ncbi:MAG: NADH-ubiquinone oxidoreductase-F iron-sulfur binding region domain-containing protein [Planctomycetota bacterium]
MAKVFRHFLVCMGSGCISSGALEFKERLETEIAKKGLGAEVKVVGTGCLGPCAVGPVAVVYPEGVFYQNLKADDAREIVAEHLEKGRVVERLISKEPKTGAPVPEIGKIAYFSRQNKIVLRNCGIIDPEKIEDYIAMDGYQALAKVLGGMKPEAVIDTVKRSGLRGRGGAGFPTATKWELARKAQGDEKFILCNGDEGDPGAFMNRSVLESDPHSVIEGMIIGGYAIGAARGYAYIRAEYPLAVKRFSEGLEQARKLGFLGAKIMGTDFSFDIEVRQGSGAFVCGEETALMRSVEGQRGEPRPRPPFPANKGLWEKPSVLNNVETFADIPVIIMKGAEWYAAIGTAKSKGTKVFCLAGNVTNTGLVEVPIGTPLGDIVYDIGGGIKGGRKFKATQIGGPSGGCIPREHLNVPVDYESLQELGAIMGSGGLVVIDDTNCMVDVARFFLEFVQDESCGKCTPCRLGTKRMLEILERICHGQGVEGDVEKLIELGTQIKETALCGLGQTAPNPVLSTIRHFRAEYDAHIRDKKCVAGVCSDLFRAPCQNACPAGVDVPGYISLIGEKRYDEALRLHRERNPLAAICARVCFHPCENACRRSMLDESVSVHGLKRFMSDTETGYKLPEIRDSKANGERKIAVIGAGPAGLACAYFLARLGYKPTVFEAAEKAGGVLAQGIPAYRLPRPVLEREIRMIEKLGVTIETGKRLGKEVTLAGLRKKGYDAVFLGIGAAQGLPLGLPGEELDGVTEAMSFLKKYNLGGKVKVGAKVAVIGGGNAAIDAARTALRLGAAEVNILYRRTRDEMPAWAGEIDEAEQESIRIQTLTAPVEIVGAKGKVTGVKCCKMRLAEFDKSGRRRPVKCQGEDFIVPADMVIAAIGQKTDLAGIRNGVKFATMENGSIVADRLTGQTSVEWIFAGGDAVSGPSSVTEAIGAGERAAVGIDKFLTGAEHAFWREDRKVDTAFDPAADPVPFPRHEKQVLPVAKRMGKFAEIEQAISETKALRECKRCLRCDFRES